MKKQIETTIKQKQAIGVNLARTKADHKQLEEQLEIEKECNKELRRVYENSTGELDHWKQKYEHNAVTKVAELEKERKELSERVANADQALVHATTKVSFHISSKHIRLLHQKIPCITINIFVSVMLLINRSRVSKMISKKLV